MFSFLKRIPKLNNNISIELGATYADKITGHTGVATGVCVYISGCSQVLIVSKQKEDGTAGRSDWWDIQRLERQPVEVITLQNEGTPGCDMPAPIR